MIIVLNKKENCTEQNIDKYNKKIYNIIYYLPGILKSGPFLQSLGLTLIKHTWAC